MNDTASLMDVYVIEERFWSIPSLTLFPREEERSTMRRHVFGRLRLGITPIGLIYIWGMAAAWSGNIVCMRPKRTSRAI